MADLQPVGGGPVWVGDWALPRDQQNFKVLGSPLRTEAFVQSQPALKREAPDPSLLAIAAAEDLQAAWLLLRCCAALRSNYTSSASAATADGAAEHDAALAPCIAQLLGHADHPLLDGALQTAQLAARFGGLGLRSTLADAAHWASWCVRGPKAAARVLQALQGPLSHGPPSAAAQHAAVDLRAAGDTVPDREEATWPPDAPCCSPYNREEPCDQGGHLGDYIG